MNSLNKRQIIQTEIERICLSCNRNTNDIHLLAVSKKHSAQSVRDLYQQGQTLFAESYINEAEIKIQELDDLDITWHFIGPIQSNKTRIIAQNFSWVHSVDRSKILTRLSSQRSAHMPPLKLCIQVNMAKEEQKSGCLPEQTEQLIATAFDLPNLEPRGIMVIPPKTNDPVEQKHWFDLAHKLFHSIQKNNPKIDTLSMGMSADMQKAICSGSTMVRIGTALFGPRTS